jgi:hypothetical protein
MMKIEPKILHLTLKKKWFSMILKGIKKEEYRDQSGYCKARIMAGDDFKNFDKIRFYNGGSMCTKYPHFDIEFIGTRIGTGVESWGAYQEKEYYVIELGSVIEKFNC